MGSLTVEDGDDVLPTTMTPLTMDDFEGILSKYIGKTHKLALLLDYDGTLAPIAPHPDLAIIPPETKNVKNKYTKYSYHNLT
jgi:trehalose 6-phosphate synthase/phosphatase